MKKRRERNRRPLIQTGADKSLTPKNELEKGVQGVVTVEKLKYEYVEVNSYLQHYSSLRFVIFSVYFAVMAGVISVAFGIIRFDVYNLNMITLSMRILGLLTTIAFLIYELRLESAPTELW